MLYDVCEIFIQLLIYGGAAISVVVVIWTSRSGETIKAINLQMISLALTGLCFSIAIFIAGMDLENTILLLVLTSLAASAYGILSYLNMQHRERLVTRFIDAVSALLSKLLNRRS